MTCRCSIRFLAADVERAALLADTSEDPNRIAEVQTRLADIDAWSAEGRASAILKGLGFDEAAQKRPCSDFSGGWRMRVALAAVLFSAPDLLLLDEPTNYLDLEGTIWLEAFLARYPHTVVVISHDRDLLNRAVGGILHLENKQLTFYQGNYDTFAKTRAAKRAVQAAAAKKAICAARTFAKFCRSLQGQGLESQTGTIARQSARADGADHPARGSGKAGLYLPAARRAVPANCCH